MKRILGRLTYANVIATLALFVALGGASYAAFKLPKNSVGTKQIQKEAITAAKIKRGAVTGAKINLATIGLVPSATTANSSSTAANAQALQGQTAAQIAASSKLKCPVGTTFAAGTCMEDSARPKATYVDALEACAKAGRLIPSMAELTAYDILVKNSSTPEWAGQLYYDGSQLRAEQVTQSFSAAALTSSQVPFRCSIPPSN